MSKLKYTKKDAIISKCGYYRYVLLRFWGQTPDEENVLPFIGLNPSKADAEEDDPTIRRCVAFAQREGYKGLLMLNLYAFRATKPKDLLKCPYQVGEYNMEVLMGLSQIADKVIICCGAPPVGFNKEIFTARMMAVVSCFKNVYSFGTTKEGYPRHPLYLPKTAPLIPFKFNQ